MKYLALIAMSGAMIAGIGSAQAAPAPAMIKLAVTPAGLDLGSSAGVYAFSKRLRTAALQVCMQSAGIDNPDMGEYLLGDCIHRTAKAAIATAPAHLADVLRGKDAMVF